MNNLPCPRENCDGHIRMLELPPLGTLLDTRCSTGHPLEEEEAKVVLAAVAQSMKPVQDLHRLVELRLDPDGVRYLRQLVGVEAALARGNTRRGQAFQQAAEACFQHMVLNGRMQEFLNTINTAFDEVGCGAPICNAPDGKHHTIDAWW